MGAGNSTPAVQRPIKVYDAQLSHPGGTPDPSPPYFRNSPLRLITFDLGVFIKNALQIPNIINPPYISTDVGIEGGSLQVIYLLISFGLTGLALFTLMTGLPSPWIVVGVIVLTVLGMSRWQGKEVTMGKRGNDDFDDEAWLFVNGIGTDRSGLDLILIHLYKVFGRQVIGIHNKTYGLWWDFIECILQRDFLWATEDIRVGYQLRSVTTICNHIRDPLKKKVVLLAHSQGGIIMSTWVDQLLSDFSADALRKVEIYTFAAAANHFSVPSSPILPDSETEDEEVEKDPDLSESKGTGSRQIGRRGVFGCVEHFVNTKDYVSLIGLIEFAPGPPRNTVPGVLPDLAAEGRFTGRIFRREGQTGHFLIAHYLTPAPGASILDHPTVEKYSQLYKYKGAGRAAVEKRPWKLTV